MKSIIDNRFLLMVLVADIFSHPNDEKSVDVHCEIVSAQCICMMSSTSETFVKLYQTYDNESFIGDIPGVYLKDKNVTLTIQLDLFDNNTFVKLADWYNFTFYWSYKLLLTSEDIIADHEVTPMIYTDRTDIQFSCEEFVNATNYRTNLMGFINTTTNKIKSFDETYITINKFKMADNGTILCCLYYTWKYEGDEIHLERFVEKKTLLIYQPKAIAGNQKLQRNWLTYLLTTSIGICLLMLLLYIIRKKHCFTKSQPREEVRETVEPENNAHENQVLYADLDLENNENLRQYAEIQNEESPYASIDKS